jgi:dUTP pyrophosphatase
MINEILLLQAVFACIVADIMAILVFTGWFNKSTLKVRKMVETAVIPTYGSSGAAGLDLSSVYEYTIPPLSRVLVNTGISVKVPNGTYGRVAPRSGLAKNHGIDVMAGVIDPDYRGVIGVILFNTDSNVAYQVKPGDRIAQLILEKYESNAEVVEKTKLSTTERGSDGFGSTGTSTTNEKNE